jgi:predicted Zn-dependent protease
MAETSYSHAGLGFGFDVPPGWVVELESANALFPVIVSMRAHADRHQDALPHHG